MINLKLNIYHPFISYEKIIETKVDEAPSGSQGVRRLNELQLENLNEDKNGGKNHEFQEESNDGDQNESKVESLSDINNMIIVGGIAKENELIIYGYDNNYLLFLKQSQEYIVQLKIDNINDKLSCKFISDEIYICAMIINSKINIIWVDI